jgi:hypothetical protein
MHKTNSPACLLVSALCILSWGCNAIDDFALEEEDLTPEARGARTEQQCVTAAENWRIPLSCPFGWVIQSIDWASYGLPSGSCPTFTTNTSCHTDARFKLSSCVGLGSCNSVTADNQTFGNPCPTSTWPKKIAVKYTCREDTTKFVLQDFVGQYERSPILNDWHKVDITLVNNTLRWKNAAGTSWALSYVNGVLKTGADCPYGVKEIDIEKKSGTNTIQTLIVGGERFVRKSSTVYDSCPNDPNKTEPGECGCGTPEGCNFIGHYERSPVLNDWHKVDIAQEATGLRWKNAAGRNWSLSYQNGILKTGADCDYGEKVIAVEKVSGSSSVLALTLNGDRYVKGTGSISTCAKPQVSLIPPAQGFSFKTNETIVLQARVSDDRTAAASLKVEWRSDLYGLIGTESPASDGVLRHTFKEAAVGTHTIDLSVTDSDCGTTKQSFKVTFACPVGSQFCPVPISVNGPPSKRTNFLFIGDGYTATEQAKYRTYVTNALAFIFGDQNPPYKRYTRFINIWMLPLSSRQSGADDSKNGIEVDTVLDGDVQCANFNSNCYSLGCDCMVNWATAGDVVTKAFQAGLPTAGLPAVGRNLTHITLNTDLWGGGAHGASWGKFTVQAARPASGVEAFYILTHEIGHLFHGFADWGHFPENDNDWFPATQSEARDTSKDPTGNKWREWLGAPQPDNGSAVGAYEGCCYVYGKGIWHPSLDSRMWHIERPFDRVQRQYVIQDIYKWSRPIDASFPSSLQLKVGDTASVQIIDPNVQQVTWTVDGKPVGNGGNSFNTSFLGSLTPGAHTLTATVRDRVLDNAYTNNTLDLVRSGGETMEQKVNFVLQVP